MKKYLTLAALALLALTLPAAAQEDVRSEIAKGRAGLESDTQAIVAEALHLTDAEGQAFWPIYRDYRNELAKVTDRNVDLILSFADKYESLTEEDSKKILKDYFEIQKSQNSVREKYTQKFVKVLPAKKVVRLTQVENKIDSLIRLDMAANIPLAK